MKKEECLIAIIRGILTSRTDATASHPVVRYAVRYEAERKKETAAEVSLRLHFAAWMSSSNALLGTGIQLTVFARVSGDAWHSVTLKSGSASWRGTTAHGADLLLPVSTRDKSVRVEWYVSRAGSTYKGTAGAVGSAAKPKVHTAALPACQTGSGKRLYCRHNGAWRQAVPYIRLDGVWRQAVPFVRVNGVWKASL